MNKQLTALIFSIAATVQLYAQEVDWDRYEVGVDLLWLIDKNSAPFSFFVKRIELKQKKNDFGFIRRGFRLRVGGSYYHPDEEFASQNNFTYHLTKNRYTLLVRPGYEWHKKIKSYDFHYGADMSFNIWGSKSVHDYYYYDQALKVIVPSTFGHTNRFGHVGISPVAGVTIRVIRGLNLTLESAATISYVFGKIEFENYDGFDDLVLKSRGWDIDLAPLYTFNAAFTF